MAQYSITKTTPGDLVVNTVLDTDTNQITYTVTAPNGATATNTQSADMNGSASSNLTALREQLKAGGVDSNAVQVGLLAAVRDSTQEAKNEAAVAQVEAVRSGTPPPDENKAIPINPDSDVTVAESLSPGEEVVQNEKPETLEDMLPQTEDTPGPTEQVVIDATDEPQLTKEDQAAQEKEQANNRAKLQAEESQSGLSTRGLTQNARAQATKNDAISFQKKPDWRVRLSLSPGANYLYKVADGQAGILNPLQKTDGVIFPYTPAVSVTYTAGYDSSDIVHSNYKVFQYKGSSVDNLQITGDFTAQDTTEANYMLAVIHFFRSLTKMFYGQDQNPRNGVPPPLVYLSGLGTYQFDAHPLAITNFTYSLPTDVDYIRAGSITNTAGQNLSGQQTPVNSNSLSLSRIITQGLAKIAPTWTNQQSLINSEATYVPTKIQLQISAIPIVTRNDISNNFSLAKYATGELLRGTKRSGGGIW